MKNEEYDFSSSVCDEIMKKMSAFRMHSEKEPYEINVKPEKYITIIKKEKKKKPTNYVRERLEATVIFSEKT